KTKQKYSGHTSDKVKLSQAKHTSVPTQVKPFAGKVFYLDLPSNRVAETLESDIKQLGGTVEKFFSKDIKYLVSNKREARYVNCLRQDSPVPSPDSGPSSPYLCSNPHRPGSHGDIKSRSQGQTDTFVASRGKSLVERVVKEQERIQVNKILSNALEWGVKILYVDDLIAYVHKKKKIIKSSVPAATAAKLCSTFSGWYSSSCFANKRSMFCIPGGRIGKPFIKVEDSSRHYRPLYLTMSNMPEFNLKTTAPCSPFCPEEKDPPANKQRGQRYFPFLFKKSLKNREKKRGGYCECCMIKYNQLTMHLQSESHRAFSKSDEYLLVDRLISTLNHNFMHIPHEDINSSTLRVDNMNIQNNLSSKSLSFFENEQQSDKKVTGKNDSGKKEGCLPTESCSPVQKIQRRIKVYKHKRRKLDTNIEHVEPGDVSDNSLLKLWKLFQSSDDMDVEFHGFEDYK
uniref:Protein DBF4 homolog A n=1 Tax=Neolamprologus brichardi TaxID=32507 RepID=A0A3Q4MFH4_NEOBR